MKRFNAARTIARSLFILALWLTAASASAQATLINGLGGPAGFGTGVLAANDDGSSTVINLASAFPAGLNFFGTTHSSIYVNNNGNVTFAGPVGAYTPTAFPIASQPMIAPWWGDVDTRVALTGGQNLVYWDVRPGRFIATWYNVGYYDSHVDRLNAFQVILTDASASGAAGDFDVEFRYNRCLWTTGDVSGGVAAQAGFDAGNGMDYLELPGSRTAAVVNLCTTSNVGMTGVWRFQIRSGAIAVCGNSILEMGEGCDDGNTTNGDGCNARCAIELPGGSPCVVDTDCRSGFCTDGVCCNERCFGQCEACNRGGSIGTCGATAGAPVGSRPACAGTGSTCGGACNGSLRTACTYPGAATSCDDGAFCTAGDVCNGAGACAAGPARDCSDPLSCTADACDEATDMCTNTLSAGCIIDGACVPDGGVNPLNPCEVCAPSVSTNAWSPAAAGTSCDDGLFCTDVDACDGAGACVGSARDCGDGIDCTLDVCDESAGVCTSMVVDTCRIDGTCIPDTTPNPANPCEVCDPTRDTAAWSPAASGTACDDGTFCTDADACDGAGACVGTARDCGDGLDCTDDSCNEDADACESTLAAGCLIEAACVADGASSSTDACLICDPSQSTDAYVRSDAAECVDAGVVEEDASVQLDAGTDAGSVGYEVRGSGCGCRAGGSGGAPLGLALIALAIAFIRRRR